MAKLEDDVAVLRRELDIINEFHKSRLAKLEIKKIKDGNY